MKDAGEKSISHKRTYFLEHAGELHINILSRKKNIVLVSDFEVQTQIAISIMQ